MTDNQRILLELSTSDENYSAKLQAIVKSVHPYKETFSSESEFNYFMSNIIANGGKTCSLWWECLAAITSDRDYSKIRNTCYYGDKPLLTLEVEKTKIVGFNLEKLVVHGIKYQPTGDMVAELGIVSTYETVIQLLELLPTLVGDLFKVIVREAIDGNKIGVRLEPNGNVCGFTNTFYHECTLDNVYSLKSADILVKDTSTCIDNLNKILSKLNVLIYRANCWLDKQKEITVC